MVNKRTIIVISNPFGFGPVGKAMAIMDEITSSLKDEVEVIYGASDKCLGPLSKSLRSKVKIEKTDERNPKQLALLFRKYDNPLIIVCLNRIAINTAKKMNLRAFFIDSLAWLWKEIPRDYLKADIYYAYDLFDAKKKIKGIKNAKLIPPALGRLPPPRKNKNGPLLIQVGGLTNPLVPDFSRSYILMLASALNKFTEDHHPSKIIIAGNNQPLDFLKQHLIDKDIFAIATLSRQDFLSAINNSKHFVTTPGITAALEAFALRTPTSFLPPVNLSQWKQLRLLAADKAAPSRIEWENYYHFDSNLELLDERGAIPALTTAADFVWSNNQLRSRIENDIVGMLQSNQKEHISQCSFVQRIKTSGAKSIADDLLAFLK